MYNLVAAAGVLVCGLAVTAADAAAAQSGSALLPAKLTVHVKDFRYNPAPARIHVGDRVTFVNDDDEAHTITASDKSFDSQGLDSGSAWQHVFTKAGTYAYFCELHPYMKATIIVLPIGGTQRAGGQR